MRALFTSRFFGAICNSRVLLFFLMLLVVSLPVSAQVGVGTTTPHGSAQLEVSANDKGILIPRLTEAQRVGMAGELADGLMVYQTDGESGFWYYSSASDSWVRMANMNNMPSASAGAIIPFSSGAPATMTTILGGLVGTTAVVGHGSSYSGISILGNTIDLTGAVGLSLNHAFSVPRDGVITSLSGYISLASGFTLLGATITIRCQLYGSATPDNVFQEIPGAFVDLSPGLTGILQIGDISSSIKSGLSVPVTAGTRLLMVVSASAVGGAVANTVVGYVSAGVNIQ